jgi:hypothetical protein
VATALDQSGPLADGAGKAVDNLLSHQRDFAAADAIPAKGVGLVAETIWLLASGLILLATGLATLLTGRRIPLIAAAFLAALTIGSVFGLSLPGKANHAQRLVHSLNITKRVAVKTTSDLALVETGVRRLDHQMLPDLARRLGVTIAAFQAQLSQSNPALGRILANYPSFIAPFAADAAFRQHHVGDFAKVRNQPITRLPWLLVGGASAVVVVSAWGLVWPVLDRRTRAGVGSSSVTTSPIGP